MWLAREVNPSLYARMFDICRQNGGMPNIVREVLTYDELLDAIATGAGWGFVKESTARRSKCEASSTDPQLTVDVGVIWRADNRSKSLAALLSVLGQTAEDEEARLNLGKT